MGSAADEIDKRTEYPATIQPGKVESSNLPPKQNSNRELFRVKASHLVDFFPDELVVQEKTISVIRREFMVSYVETLPVRDIGRVVYINTPIFAGLRIIGKNTAHELHIRGLPKQQAQEAEKVVEGLLLEDKGVVEVPQWLHTEERRERLAEAAEQPDEPHASLKRRPQT